MIQYTTRYIDLKKCHHIREMEICNTCGWEFHFHYILQKEENMIIESKTCRHCQHTKTQDSHKLH